MIPGIIGSQINRSTRNMLVFNCLMVIVLLVIPVFVRGFLYNFLLGPDTVNVEAIPKMDPDTASRYWVRADVGKHHFESQYVEISGSKGEKTYYHVLDLADGALLVASDDAHPGTVIEGTLSGMTGEATDKVMPLLTRPFGKALYPVMINNPGMRLGGWLFFIAWVPALALGIWNIAKAVRRMGDPRQHPVCAVLKKFGEPEEIAVGIDAEFKAGAEATGNVQLTQSWLMRKRTYGVDLVYLGDVVWAYRKEVKHSTNGVPTGTTYSSMVYDKNGKSLNLALKKKQVEDLLANIHRKVPWVVVGYDKKLSVMWQKERAKLLGMVEARKEEYLKAASAAEAGRAEAGGAAPPVQG